jgi:hypothetical protein
MTDDSDRRSRDEEAGRGDPPGETDTAPAAPDATAGAGEGRDTGSDDGDGTEAREWRFALDEVGEDAEPVHPPLEPESPSLENALFVAAGVLGTVLLLLGGL